jgi:hypothetical protein
MLLADLASHPASYQFKMSAAPAVSRAKKFVIRDSGLAAIAALRTNMPERMNELRQMAHLPYDEIFVEYNMGAYRASFGGNRHVGDDADTSGVLITKVADDLFQFQVIDSIGPVRSSGRVLLWPVKYLISTTNDDVAVDESQYRVKDGRHPLGSPEYDASCWGYSHAPTPRETAKLMKPLRNKIMCVSTVNSHDDREVKLLQSTIKETSGISRHIVGFLALLNGPAERIQSDVTGRKIIHGTTRRAAVPEYITMRVPKKVANYERFVFNACREAARKRLHDVRGHYRYLRRQPNALNWERVEIEGEVMWRRWINAHERGSEEMGDLRGRTAVVY